ncbi:MAG: sensor histidine kinase [Clostridiales bacterium]|nr:sensor histidine kinase [Clostridiales bacterium]
MKKIYSYWLKMFYVYTMYFITAVAVIFAVCTYSYRQYTIGVALEYSKNLLKTGEANFDADLKQYASLLHNFGAYEIKDVVDKKSEYISEGIYEYNMSQALQAYANRIKSIRGVVFFDNDLQQVSIGIQDTDKFYDWQKKYSNLLEEYNGAEMWRCDGQSLVLCKKLYTYEEKLVPIGYIYIIINPDDVAKSCDELKKTDDEFIVLNDVNEIILSSDKSMISKNREEIIKNKKNKYRYNNTSYYMFCTESRLRNLRYGYMMNINSINKSENMVILRFFTIVLIFGLLTLLMVRKIYRRQGEPLNEITRCMHEASNGNLRSRTTYNKNDEIGYLSIEFNKMMDKLDAHINQTMEMEIQLKKAQLKAYESQINPHFLYNTLDLIRMMSITEESDKVEEIILSLADMLRYNLSPETKVRICDEIKSIENYFKILSIRFGDKFDYSFDVDEQVKNCRILKFIIQPLVENSVKHGTGKMNKAQFIEVACKLVGSDIAIIVSDNGVGMSQQHIEEIYKSFEEDSDSEKHIGIKNIYKRLRLCYGDKSIIEIYSTEGKNTKVLLKIPYTETDGD